MTKIYNYKLEDLPTEEEFRKFIIENYWEPRVFTPKDPKWKEKDSYWGILRYKVLLGTCCNKINQLLGSVEKWKFDIMSQFVQILYEEKNYLPTIKDQELELNNTVYFGLSNDARVNPYPTVYRMPGILIDSKNVVEISTLKKEEVSIRLMWHDGHTIWVMDSSHPRFWEIIAPIRNWIG